MKKAIADSAAKDTAKHGTDGKDKVRRFLARNTLPLGKLITIAPNPRFVPVRTHTHDFVEMCYMRTGQTVHIINGKELLLRKGEVLILNQHAIQEILPAGENDFLINFIILPQFFGKPLEMLGEEDTPLRRFIIDCIAGRDNTDGYLHFRTADVMPIQHLFEALILTFAEEAQSDKIIEFTMGLILLELVHHSDRLFSDSIEKSSVLQVLQYIEENYQSGTLSEIAEHLHYDLYWLSRKLKDKTGKNFTELLQEKRLSQAEHLLLHTNMKVADIAAIVGYNNTSFFHRIFEKRYGISPKKYRDRYAAF